VLYSHLFLIAAHSVAPERRTKRRWHSVWEIMSRLCAAKDLAAATFRVHRRARYGARPHRVGAGGTADVPSIRANDRSPRERTTSARSFRSELASIEFSKTPPASSPFPSSLLPRRDAGASFTFHLTFIARSREKICRIAYSLVVDPRKRNKLMELRSEDVTSDVTSLRSTTFRGGVSSRANSFPSRELPCPLCSSLSRCTVRIVAASARSEGGST